MTNDEWLAELDRVQALEEGPEGFTVLDVAKKRQVTIGYARVWVSNLILQGTVLQVGERRSGKGIAKVYQVADNSRGENA